MIIALWGSACDTAPLVGEEPGAVAGSGIAVELAASGTADAGESPKNVVNRLSPNGGVQIEQSPTARSKYGDAIADAVARVFAAKL